MIAVSIQTPLSPGPEHEVVLAPVFASDFCACGQPSEFGGHGIRDGEVYDLYMCARCYNRKKREHV